MHASGTARTAIIALASGLLLLATGCRHGSVEPAASPVPGRVLAVTDPHLAFHIEVPTSQRLKRQPGGQTEGCPALRYQVEAENGTLVTFEAYAASCEAPDNTSLGNGRHGWYRTPTDLSADQTASASQVPTRLGEALVFTQRYYECTNSCKHWNEPVALIALDHPTDPGYPTLTIRSDHAVWGKDTLTAFVRDRLQP